MKKIKLKDISLAYKISLTAGFLVLFINLLSVFFVLLPIYDLVGNTSIDGGASTESDNKLTQAERTTSIISGVTYTLVAVSLISGSYGAYQDVRKKSKTKS